jgi:hypothetical protein
MTEMTREQKDVEEQFNQLIGAQKETFPEAGKRKALNAPESRGVYVIYDPCGLVVHVGRTPSGKGGLAQRLQNHLHSQSSFTEKYPPLNGDGSKLRDGYTFRCISVPDDRLRALLEAYAIGHLCPAHIGLNSRTGDD